MDSSQTGEGMFPVAPSVYATENEEAGSDLELVSELPLDPGCHLRLCFIHGLKQVILEIDYLREYREPLVVILR